MGLVLAAVAVAGVAAVAGASGDDGGSGVGVDPDLVTTVVDAASFALLTLGVVLAIAVMILQFGGMKEPQERRPGTRKLQLAVMAIALLLLAPPALGFVADWLQRQEAPVERDEGLLPTAPRPSDDATAGTAGGDAAPAVGIGLGVAGAVVVAMWLWSGSRRRAALDAELGSEATEARSLVHLLLDDAIAQLRDDPDPRAAVIATWARLEVALAAAELPRHEAEAPRPYLERVLGSVQASAAAARRLALTFERAMFSPHTIDRAAQVEAVDALVAVRDELAVEVRT